jgi:DNA-binding PadR family transcriptional regulator
MARVKARSDRGSPTSIGISFSDGLPAAERLNAASITNSIVQRGVDIQHIYAYYSHVRRKAEQLIPFEVAIIEAALLLHKRGVDAFHGYALATAIKAAADQRMLTAYGTLYRALHRLDKAGLVESFWEAPESAESEGRPRRRLYRLTAAAEKALHEDRIRRRAATKLRSLKPKLGTR